MLLSMSSRVATPLSRARMASRTDEFVGSLGGSGHLGYRQGGGVGGEEGLLFDEPVQFSVKLDLLLQVFGDPLDYEITIGEIRQLYGPLDPSLDLLFVLLGSFALFYGLGEAPLDPPQSPLQELVIDFADDDLISRFGGDLHNAGAHQTTAADTYSFYLHKKTPYVLGSSVTRSSS